LSGENINNKSDFEIKRKSFNSTTEIPSSVPGTSKFGQIKLKDNLASQGEIILEKKFQISKDEQNYYKNKHVYSNVNH
jgi:hypothetical protein